MALDGTDLRIVDLLQQNARATQSDIAAAVGLTQPAVAERIRKLEQERIIISYAARVDPRRLGKDITAFIGVGIEHPKFNAAFAQRILSLADVLECHHVTGQDSYLLKVITESTESLDRLISEQIRTIPGVTRTQTTIVMSSVKEGSHVKPAARSKPQRGKIRKRKAGGL